jgi:hypothetical protein
MLISLIELHIERLHLLDVFSCLVRGAINCDETSYIGVVVKDVFKFRQNVCEVMIIRVKLQLSGQGFCAFKIVKFLFKSFKVKLFQV